MTDDESRGPREDRAREDYHDPTAGFGGAAPARSALTLRLVLAAFGLVVCTLGAAAFVILANEPVLSGILTFLAAAAVEDIVVGPRRTPRGEPPSPRFRNGPGLPLWSRRGGGSPRGVDASVQISNPKRLFRWFSR